MVIGIIKEEDQRAALSPDVVKQFVNAGNEVLVEQGTGETVWFGDSDYQNVGAKVASTADEVFKSVDVLVSLWPLSEEQWTKLKSEAVLVSNFSPYVDSTIPDMLQQLDFTVFSMDMIPRTTLAQSMDVLSSMASIAGYQAVLEAAQVLPRYFPMLSTAAGTVAPAKVLVLGAGVAGLQAIATAKRLGARVEAFDTRAAAKQEVESLGAKFVEVEGATDDTSAGGYGVDQTDEYKSKQRATIAEKAASSDVIITTAQVRGPKAPLLITRKMVEGMKPGSVIVDLAASTGGNCELTENARTVRHNNVTIIGDSNLAAKVSLNATQLFSKNVYNFLNIMITEGRFEPDWDNVIIKESCIARPELVDA